MKKHCGPSPSERTLFVLWDRVDEERNRKGERAAHQLAAKALKALEAPKGKDKQND